MKSTARVIFMTAASFLFSLMLVTGIASTAHADTAGMSGSYGNDGIQYSQPYDGIQYNSSNYYYSPAQNYSYNYRNTVRYQAAPTQKTAPVKSAPAATTGSAISGLTAKESQMYNLVNQDRINNGLAPLSLDMNLVNLARMKSQDMYQNNYFSHTSPTYGSAYQMEKNAGLSYSIMGAENIAKAPSVQYTENAFMNSSGHRANILNSQYNTVGIGIVDSQSGVVVTQLFAKK
ncbi:CAP domain-containing protein [Pelotomaculum propionicicum]|uniref:SCP domain-containing protein n=1 Tax=Pelotomaculum propionicicum TaxID=258475 RepID=A0A4Y7RQ35_9FIRM|nr:CAP domain-containing protein [Pelotomaculum propionicicum]NLI14273.1 sporulation protein [Peptococcaceae bacterium]TEB10971.1 hypothetical protein Pmgp_01987 [Pelotomaculum propionicicum]